MTRAESTLRRAAAADPTEPAAHFNLGLLFAGTGNTEEAQQDLRKTLDLDPPNVAAAYDLAAPVGKGNPQEALALCQKAAELKPGNPKYGRAVEYYREQLNESCKP
jgi:tetratricopeptide (TPR) repeat protein